MNGTSANFRILSSRHKLVLITVPVSGVGTAGRLGQVAGQGSAPSPTVITLGCSAPAASSFPSPGPRPPQFPAVAPAVCAVLGGRPGARGLSPSAPGASRGLNVRATHRLRRPRGRCRAGSGCGPAPRVCAGDSGAQSDANRGPARLRRPHAASRGGRPPPPGSPAARACLGRGRGLERGTAGASIRQGPADLAPATRRRTPRGRSPACRFGSPWEVALGRWGDPALVSSQQLASDRTAPGVGGC